jgi:hypothetical protein
VSKEQPRESRHRLGRGATEVHAEPLYRDHLSPAVEQNRRDGTLAGVVEPPRNPREVLRPVHRRTEPDGCLANRVDRWRSGIPARLAAREWSDGWYTGRDHRPPTRPNHEAFDVHPEQGPHPPQPADDPMIFRARAGVARRVIAHGVDRARPERRRALERFARRHQRGVDQADRDALHRDDPPLCVERDRPEPFPVEVGHRAERGRDIGWTHDATPTEDHVALTAQLDEEPSFVWPHRSAARNGRQAVSPFARRREVSPSAPGAGMLHFPLRVYAG